LITRADTEAGLSATPLCKHPSWGARKLKAGLEMLQPNVVWPAASTFGNILNRAGLTSPQRKRKRTTPCSEPFSLVTGPNQPWGIDFKFIKPNPEATPQKKCDRSSRISS
jgi:hypothetical protein